MLLFIFWSSKVPDDIKALNLSCEREGRTQLSLRLSKDSGISWVFKGSHSRGPLDKLYIFSTLIVLSLLMMFILSLKSEVVEPEGCLRGTF